MLYELAPLQAREHRCDPVGAVEFLYDSGYKYVQEPLWRTEGRSDVQVRHLAVLELLQQLALA